MSVLYQALKLGRKALGTKLFEPGDGSPYERLNLIYNKSKHADPQALPSGQLHAIWIKNEGLVTDGTVLEFCELRELIRVIGRISDKLAKGEMPDQ